MTRQGSSPLESGHTDEEEETEFLQPSSSQFSSTSHTPFSLETSTDSDIDDNLRNRRELAYLAAARRIRENLSDNS